MRRLIIIIPGAKIAAANEWLEAETGEREVFRANLNKSGDPSNPLTHAVINWNMGDSLADKVQAEFAKGSWAAKIADGEPDLREPRAGKKDGQGFMKEHGFQPLRGRKDAAR